MHDALTDVDAEAAGRWRGVRRVLAVRLDNLGDLLMTTPALAAMHESVPQLQLVLLTSPAGAALAGSLPFVNEVVVFDAPWIKAGDAALTGAPLGQSESTLVQRLRASACDAAVVFTVCTQSALPAALIARMAGIPRRLAFSRENPYGLLTDWAHEIDHVGDGMRHEVERHLALVARVGWRATDTRLRLVPDAAAHADAAQALRAAGVTAGAPYFVVHPGASAASRRWPADRFGAAAQAIARHTGATAVFTGDVGEHGLITQAQQAMGGASVSLVGRLGVAALAVLIRDATMLLANNTGPAHIAAAMGTPVVVLYAQTNPQHTPWRVRSRVLYQDVPCRHCLKSVCPMGHHDCLLKVQPDTVVDAALALLEGDGARLEAGMQA